MVAATTVTEMPLLVHGGDFASMEDASSAAALHTICRFRVTWQGEFCKEGEEDVDGKDGRKLFAFESRIVDDAIDFFFFFFFFLRVSPFLPINIFIDERINTTTQGREYILIMYLPLF